MKKYFILYFLVLAICVYSLSAKAAEILASGNCGEQGAESSCRYTLDAQGVLRISGNGRIATNAFANWAFSGRPEIKNNNLSGNNIKQVVINNGITGISTNSFHGLGNLTTVTIPKSVTQIDSMAFHYDDALKNMTIKGENTTIANNAFDSTGLGNIHLYGKQISCPAGSQTEAMLKTAISYNYQIALGGGRIAMGVVANKPLWTIPEIEDAMGDSITGEMTLTFE